MAPQQCPPHHLHLTRSKISCQRCPSFQTSWLRSLFIQKFHCTAGPNAYQGMNPHDLIPSTEKSPKVDLSYSLTWVLWMYLFSSNKLIFPCFLPTSSCLHLPLYICIIWLLFSFSLSVSLRVFLSILNYFFHLYPSCCIPFSVSIHLSASSAPAAPPSPTSSSFMNVTWSISLCLALPHALCLLPMTWLPNPMLIKQALLEKRWKIQKEQESLKKYRMLGKSDNKSGRQLLPRDNAK